MNTSEIHQTLMNDSYASKIYGGTFAIDKLPWPLKSGHLYVMNLDKSTNPGTHWVCIDTMESPLSISYLDSFGYAPPEEIIPKLLTAGKIIYYSDIAMQFPLSQACGYQVLSIILLRSRGYALHEILYHCFKADDQDYLRNDAYAAIITSALTSLKERPLINWANFFS